MTRSAVEEELAVQLKAAGVDFTREFQVCAWRKWRSDFIVWPRGLVIAAKWQGGEWRYAEDFPPKACSALIEVQGTGPQGRHGSYGHHESDCEKFSTAAALGWRVLLVSPTMVRDGRALALVEAALGLRDLEATPRPSAGRRKPKALQAAKKPARYVSSKGAAGLPLRVRKAAGL